jgi:hypothetical protein
MVHLRIDLIKILFVLFIFALNLINVFLLLKSKEIWYDDKGIYIENNNGNYFIRKGEILKFKRRFFFFYQVYLNESKFMNKRLVFFIGPNAPIKILPAVKELMRK